MDKTKLATLLETISEEIALLDKWAAESVTGGWSTHQVDPMRRRADELRKVLFYAQRETAVV